MHTVRTPREISPHRTSTGGITDRRRRCGRLEVDPDQVPVVMSVDAGHHSLSANRGPARMADRLLGVRVARVAALAAVPVTSLVSVSVGAVAVPAAALLMCLGLGLFTGVLAGVGTWFVTLQPRRGARAGLITAAVAMPPVVAVGGLIAALGPASVVVLPVLYAVVGVVWWGSHRRLAGRVSDTRVPNAADH